MTEREIMKMLIDRLQSDTVDDHSCPTDEHFDGDKMICSDGCDKCWFKWIDEQLEKENS